MSFSFSIDSLSLSPFLSLLSASLPPPLSLPLLTCSFLTVSLPMCSSLETWSSTFGISTLPAVRVLRVATTKPSETACLAGGSPLFPPPPAAAAAPPVPPAALALTTARTSSLKGGLRPESIASDESVTCRSGSGAAPPAQFLPRGSSTRPSGACEAPPTPTEGAS